MAREKRYVFSARTTEVGLKALNQVKERVNMGWDELVIEAVSAHYNMDKALMTLPKKEKTTSEAPAQQQPSAEATNEAAPTEATEEKAAEETPAKK